MSLLFSVGEPDTELGAVGDVCIDIEKADEMRVGVYTKSVGTKQVETATVAGTIAADGQGNATVTVTAAGMGNSPKAISVAVANNDTAAQVAAKIRTALGLDADVTAMFTVGGSGALVVLTKKDEAPNDATLNIAIADGTCTGLTPAATSANTTAGVEEDWGSPRPVCHGQINTGAGAPTRLDGQEGELWHDTSADEWYGPKASGAWPETAAVDIED